MIRFFNCDQSCEELAFRLTMKKYIRFVAVLLAIVVMSLPTQSRGEDAETPAQRDARMQWWREARFGMFIHWGVYSVPAGRWNGKDIGGAGEWLMHDAKIPLADYQKLPAQFNPVNFDADKWVQIAQAAGMKYMVITAKHHEGFAMFHSKADPFNIVDATPFKRDPLAELAAACQKQGMKLGLYYSQSQDWNHPGGDAMGGHWDPAQDGSMDDYVAKIAVPQVRELLTNYGPVAVLWWDTPDKITKEEASQFLPLLKLQPGIITNDRLGAGSGDTATPEQRIPATGINRDWETCMTINNTWGYKTDDANFKSTKTLLHNLIDIASKGGNYLLNVGPTSLGEIPPPEVERLKQMGQWLAVNGDSIYGSSHSPFAHYSFDGRCTVKGNRLFVQVFKWPADGVKIMGLKTAVQSAKFLDGAAPAEVQTSLDDNGVALLTIKPPAHLNPLGTVVELDLAGRVEIDPRGSAIRPAADGSLHLLATDSKIVGDTAQMEDDHIGYWTNAQNYVTWDIAAPTAGNYLIEVVYACEDASAGSEYIISGGTDANTGIVQGTGGWGRFVSRPLAHLQLKAGAQQVTVKVSRMPRGAVMNLKEVRLTRVSEP
jgi:alpha-L-fucosidase